MLPLVETATSLDHRHHPHHGRSGINIPDNKQPSSASVPTIKIKSPKQISSGGSSSDAASSNKLRMSPQHHQQQHSTTRDHTTSTSAALDQHSKKQSTPQQPKNGHHRRNLSSSSSNSNGSHYHSHHHHNQQQPIGSNQINSSIHSHSASSRGSHSLNSHSTTSSSNIVVSSFSNLATQSIALGKYRQAFEYYQLALQDYLSKNGNYKDDKELGHNKTRTATTAPAVSTWSTSRITVVDLVNAAATCFNLGALAKKMHDYPQAVGYFLQAQDMYRKSTTLVEQYYQSTSPKARKNDEGASFTSHHSSSSNSASSHSSSNTCKVCLLRLIVETLQARAHLHYKYQGLIDNAIECHEEVVELLETSDSEKSSSSLSTMRECDTTYMNKIHFTVVSKEERLQLLVTSLQALGKLYVERGELEDAIVAYQEAHSILKNLNDASIEPTELRQEEVSQILRALSEIYLQTNLESTNIAQLERIALVQEDLENWEKAMQCWERVLYCQSQEHGEESLEVSTTLSQLSRVMILEGNLEGALDLYHAAANIFLKRKAALPDDLFSEILSLYQELNLIPDAIAWVKGLSSRNRDGKPRREEEAKIRFELGKLCLEQELFAEASEALCLSAELSDGKDERVFELLQKVEFLQHRSDGGVGQFEEHDENNSSSASITSNALRNNGTSTLTAITEDGESALITEEDSEIGGVNFVNTSPSQDQSDLMGSTASALDVTLSSLVEKAKALEEEEELLDALVIGATHASPAGDESLLDGHTRISADAIVSDSSSSSDSSAAIEKFELGSSKQCEKSSSTPDGAPPERGDDPYVEVQVKRNPEEELLTEPKISLDGAAKSTQSMESSPNITHGTVSKLHSYETALYSKRAESPVYVSEDSSADESELATFAHEVVQADEEDNTVASESDVTAGLNTIEVTESVKDGFEQNDVLLEGCADEKDVDDDEEVYESFQRQLDNSSGTEESPIGHPNEPMAFQDDTRTAMMNRETSRTGLLKPIEKLQLPQKSLNMPTLASPKNSKSRDRRGYAEMPDKRSGTSQRRRIVKALASPFRRSRSKSRSRAGNELDPLDEEREVEASLPHEKQMVDEESVQASDAPVSFVNMRNDTDDDAESLVSQITFRMEEAAPKKNEKDGQWWWGVTAEGLEGWFPSSYVHQAVEAAEGFLSAKAIHDRVKSRPLDFDSDEESEVADEDISLLKDSSSKHSKTQQSSAENSKSTSARPLEASSPTRKQLVEPTVLKPSTTLGSVNAVAPSNSEGSKHLPVETQIKDKELQLETTKATNGFDDISVATVQFDLARLYNLKHDHVVAMEHCRQALKIQKATLNLADACKSLHFMADLHSRQKRYKEALACYSEAQRLQEAIYGYFHEEIANTLNRVGNVLARQGEFDLAMENHREALRILKECCGENVKHPLVSQTLIQIGAVYYKERNSLATIQSKVDGYNTFIEGGMLEIIGRAHEDRGSYRMAIAFFEEKLQFLNDTENSDDLEEVAETLNSLGMLSCRAGLYLDAIDYYDRALGIQMKLGCDDVQLAMARVLAGSVQYSLGHFNKALKLFQDALDTLRRQDGLHQETVAATLFHMGVVRAALCNYDEAMSNLRDALEIQTKLLGIDHPATFRTRREIGNLYAIYESEVDAAFEEFNDILEMQKQIHGEKHPNVAETLHSIGCAQARKGDLYSALRTLEDCYNMRLDFLGMDHPQQATTLHEIAKIQLQRGRLKKAIHIVDAALNIRVESLSENHIDVALAMATKASCLVARGNFGDANKLFLEALPLTIAAVGGMHPAVAGIHVQIGILHLRKCHFEEAAEEIQKALEIYRQSDLDEDHPGIKEAAEELERVERAEMLCV